MPAPLVQMLCEIMNGTIAPQVEEAVAVLQAHNAKLASGMNIVETEVA